MSPRHFSPRSARRTPRGERPRSAASRGTDGSHRPVFGLWRCTSAVSTFCCAEVTPGSVAASASNLVFVAPVTRDPRDRLIGALLRRSFRVRRSGARRSIRDETGLDVNPHLFRHIGAKIFLRAQPGAYEAVRRLLAHSETSSTIDAYAGFETDAAARAYAQILETAAANAPMKRRRS